ncbi:MAG: glycosyl hydrolase-related protein [Propionibacteriaceae bacterium]|jgi:alpha-mannosidase|nr:glycosyl hydrolase-related protein [Propionibacteriaceae bacterium]
MHHLSDLDGRVARALIGLRAAVYREFRPLQVSAAVLAGEPEPFEQATANRFEPFAVPGAWGRAWSTTWFRLTGEVPADWRGAEVELVVDLGFRSGGPGFECEGLAHTEQGQLVKGIEPRNRHIPLTAVAQGTRVACYIEAAANPIIPGSGPTPLGSRQTTPGDKLYQFTQADLALVDLETRELVLDLDVLWELQAQLPPGAPRRERIRHRVGQALDLLDFETSPDRAARARSILAELLASPAEASAHLVSGVGHAHIDSAWLWPVRETVRKCARSFSNVAALADDRPDLRFACSSAQQYAWIKAHYPQLFARIKELVAQGVFIPVGGMWVEPDTNMPGGEALVRQFTQGKRFFWDEFQVEPREVWLPDCFGYSGALPQLARLAGMRWMLTQKMSWNQVNRFPHHTFWWEGIDGSRLFTHFPPSDNYSAKFSGEQLAFGVRNFSDLGPANRSLMPFGYGDGGGGPTREMLWTADRLADLEGSPRVTVESPAEFFSKAESEYPDAPVWRGEMYLEFHRGTLTTHHAIKAGNRRVQNLLHQAELWSATASIRAGLSYPYQELDDAWQRMLLLQFHDILPGSSIAWVNAEARAEYTALGDILEGLIGQALAALGCRSGAPGATAMTSLHCNSAPVATSAPAFSIAAAEQVGGQAELTATGSGYLLENGSLRVLIDADGIVASVWDIAAGREVLAGPANLLQLHPDHPARFDAWDLDEYYRNGCRDLRRATAVTTLTDGRVGLAVERKDGASSYVQRVWLEPGSMRLDCELAIDWHERETILKVAFPLAVAAENSSAETQFGHVKRPTHVNTPWDAARFEVVAQRWFHVGEPGYSVALVNDSIYGHEAVRPGAGATGTPTTTVRLSLLRAPLYPDPETDQGRHLLRYALVAGAEIPDAIAEGYRLNLPVRRVTGPAAGVHALAEATGANAIIETVKLADDRSGDVIIRLYESVGGRGEALVKLGFAAESVVVVDLLERPSAEAAALSPLGKTDVGHTLWLKPFQIATLRVRPTGDGLRRSS